MFSKVCVLSSGKEIAVLERSCDMASLENIANKVHGKRESKGSTVTRSAATKMRERARLGLDDEDGGACRSRRFNDVVQRGILPSGEVVYEVSYVIGLNKTITRWEYASSGEY